MKYFTPELLTRFGSVDDEVATGASLEWDQAQAAYRKHLREIRAVLPRGVLRLLRRFYLHDARVLTLAATETPSFSMVLQLNHSATHPGDYWELKYRLVGSLQQGLRVVKHPELAGEGRPFGWWLYDEIDVRGSGPPEAITQTILFTGGYELHLSFSNFVCRRLKFVYQPGSSADEEILRVLELLEA